MTNKELAACGGVTLSDIMREPRKAGIAPENMIKLLDCLRDELPEEYYQIAKKILYDNSTNYF